jgi:hypothetical protein
MILQGTSLQNWGKSISQTNHACKPHVSKICWYHLQEHQPVGWRWLVMFAVEDAWLLLLICPPPLGLASAYLLFTSWVNSCLLLVLLLLRWILNFRNPLPWPCWWSVGVGERTVVFSWWSCECLLLWTEQGCAYPTLVECSWCGVLLCLHACQQPALQVELLVSSWLFSTQTWSDSPGTWCGGLLGTQMCCTQKLKRADTSLDH